MSQQQSGDLSSIRVVIADDSTAWIGFVKARLAEEHAQVVGIAFDGEQAAQQVEALQPDLVILNISLPKRSGVDVARQARTRAPNTKILLATSEADAGMIRRALDAGADGLVLKSQAESTLIDAIAAVMRRPRFVDMPESDPPRRRDP
jgi:two-component system response regulator DesR